MGKTSKMSKHDPFRAKMITFLKESQFIIDSEGRQNVATRNIIVQKIHYFNKLQGNLITRDIRLERKLHIDAPKRYLFEQ